MDPRAPAARAAYDPSFCPIARATELMGDGWTPVILRDLAFGICRFESLQERLAIPRATLSKRLERLVAEGMAERFEYQQHPPRHEYRLTEKGRGFFAVLAAMWRWGEDWLFPVGDTVPVRLADRDSGATIRPIVVDERTGEAIDLARVRVRSAASAYSDNGGAGRGAGDPRAGRRRSPSGPPAAASTQHPN